MSQVLGGSSHLEDTSNVGTDALVRPSKDNPYRVSPSDCIYYIADVFKGSVAHSVYRFRPEATPKEEETLTQNSWYWGQACMIHDIVQN